MLLVVVAAIALFVGGIVIGWCVARHNSGAAKTAEGEPETVLQLLDDLSGWTRQYSGDLSEHQDLLDSLSRSAGGDDPLSSDRALAVLQQVVRSNNELQKKLATAEGELDAKSRQIKDYLAEARTDALTGLANRRAFDQKLQALFTRHRQGGMSFVVALIDLDHFKNVNDQHGHAAGDRVLADFAGTLGRELADAILVARFGGEEFAVILDDPLRRSAQRMEEVRKKIAGQQSGAGELEVHLTISVGLSEPLDDIGPASVVRRADEALYAAKRIGRNRVYFHDGRQPTWIDAPEVVS